MLSRHRQLEAVTRPLQEIGADEGFQRADLVADRAMRHPEFFRCPPDLTEMLLEAEAAVLIGDVALRALYDAPKRGLYVTDLGQAWREWTGLPMVFAVWAVRREFAQAHPGLVKDGVEAHLHELLADHVETLGSGWRLIRREYPTAIGPVDLLCRDETGAAVAVEIKRRGAEP